MPNITQGNISFTVNVGEGAGGFATKRTLGGNNGVITNGKYDINKKQSGNYFYINAIDIDWNNAKLPNSDSSTSGLKTIQTTGELLKLIDDMQKEIYVLTAAVIALNNS